MAKKTYVNFDGKNVIMEGLLVKRVQTAGASGNFDNEDVQELANKGLVASIKTDESFDITLDLFDRGSIDMLKHICGKDISTPNIGTVNEIDLSTAIIDTMFQTETDDGDLDRVDYFPNMSLSSLAMNFSVDGNASENYSFGNSKRKIFLGSNKTMRITRGSYSTADTVLLPFAASGEMTETSEAVGAGDDVETIFALAASPIKVDAYTIYVDSVEATEGSDYNLDLTTGLISFSSPVASGSAITADYTTEGAEVKYLSINGAEIPSAEYTQSEDTLTLLASTIDSNSRIVLLYLPKSNAQKFESLETDLSETAVLRRGQIDLFFFREGDPESKQLRVQSVDININFDRNELYELGREESYASSVNSRTVEISLNLNQSDIEIIAKAAGKEAEYEAGTLTELDFSTLVKDLVLVVRVYNSASTKDASTLLREIKIEKIGITNPSENISVGSVAEESYSATSDNCLFTGGGNL